MRLSWVLLTLGDRSEVLDRAVASIAGQRGVDQEIIVVANGARIVAPPSARLIELPTNLGIPAGRNEGAHQATGDVIVFLDDDAACASPDLAAALVEAFRADDRLGIVSFRIVVPETGESLRRHVPRLHVGDPARSSDVTTFLGGACAVRRAVFDEVGWLPGHFRYAMEETDLAWRALDAGWRIRYRGDLVVHHPPSDPLAHPEAQLRTMRNRVWLVRRRLPVPLGFAYICVWAVVTLARARSLEVVVQILRGLARGVREPAGPGRRIGWGTVWRMTRLGRPPII